MQWLTQQADFKTHYRRTQLQQTIIRHRGKIAIQQMSYNFSEFDKCCKKGMLKT